MYSLQACFQLPRPGFDDGGDHSRASKKVLTYTLSALFDFKLNENIKNCRSNN